MPHNQPFEGVGFDLAIPSTIWNHLNNTSVLQLKRLKSRAFASINDRRVNYIRHNHIALASADHQRAHLKSL